MLLILCLPIVSYLMFVFVSETLNPFTQVESRLRRPYWRLGRSLALVSMVSGLLSIYLMHMLSLDSRLAVALYLAATIVLILPSFLKFRRSRFVF